VPQGSVLGPIFFLVYINDVSNIFANSDIKHKLFADDLKLYSTVVTNDDVSNFQAMLDRLKHGQQHGS